VEGGGIERRENKMGDIRLATSAKWKILSDVRDISYGLQGIVAGCLEQVSRV